MNTDPRGQRKVRVGFVSAWVSRLGGGVTEASLSLAQALQSTGRVDVSVFGLLDEFAEVDKRRFNNLDFRLSKQYGPRSFGFSPALFHDVMKSDLDLVHLHGIWMFPSVVGAAWAKQFKRPYVISPHGMLEEWILSRNHWKKRLALLTYENNNLSQSHILHALNPEESLSIKKLIPSARIVEIPNGIDLSAMSERKENHPPYICFLGRLHPKKNVETLLAAWAQLKNLVRAKNYHLIIAGWGEEDYVKTIEAQIQKIGHEANIKYIGSQYGVMKAKLLGDAKYLVLPSFSEGLPMVVLEAWASGTPTLMTEFCNLSEGFAAGAALRIGTSVAELTPALVQILNSDESDWVALSKQARALAQRRFSLPIVSERWVDLYTSLIDKAEFKRTSD